MKYNSNVHSTLLVAVGAYLLYLAWVLLEKYRSDTNEMPPFWNIAAIIVFVLSGLGTLYYAWSVYRKGKKKDIDEEDEKEEDKN